MNIIDATEPGINSGTSQFDNDGDDESQEPDTGAVFTMTDGEKIRIEFANIFTYRSTKRGAGTIVELGWAPDTETIPLDIAFSDFDQLVQANKEAWEEYYESQNDGDADDDSGY